MAENRISVRLQIRQQRVKEELEEIVSSLGGFRLQNSGSQLSCDLLILEIGDDLQKEFQNIHAIMSSGAVREVFLSSSRTESDILIQALRAGIKEFFPQPIKKEEVSEALLKFKGRGEKGRISRPKGKIVDVIGSKGGVGTTTVAVNLATSLNELEGAQSVALIDMNLLFGEIPIFLNIESTFNWGEVAKNISRLDSTYLMSFLSKHSSGVYVLPSPSGLDGTNVATPQVMEKLLNLMQATFDFTVIDSGQSLDDLSLKILEMSDTVLLVSILNLPCLSNVKKLQNTFWKLGYPREENLRIIFNRHHKKSVISLKEAEEAIDKKIFWLVPNDYSTSMSAINQGKALSMVAHDAEISKSFRELAAAFSGKEERKEKRRVWNKGFFREKITLGGEMVMNRKVPGER
jgi:pilus assembly protein CpaE